MGPMKHLPDRVRKSNAIASYKVTESDMNSTKLNVRLSDSLKVSLNAHLNNHNESESYMWFWGRDVQLNFGELLSATKSSVSMPVEFCNEKIGLPELFNLTLPNKVRELRRMKIVKPTMYSFFHWISNTFHSADIILRRLI